MRKMSIMTLSHETKISRATIGRIEKGKANPTHSNLEAIAHALGVRIEILL